MQEWLEAEETRELIKVLKDKIEDIKEEWADGAFSGSIEENIEALATARAYKNVLEVLK